jgi:hypothetical protein
MSLFNNSIIKKNKDFIVYNYKNIYEIAFGKTQLGNDKIIDLYQDVKHDCYWYHLYYDTSAHLIIYNKSATTIQSSDENLILEYFYPKDKIIIKNKKPVIMKCLLSDIKKTKTLGMVNFSNEKIIKI